MARFMPRPLLMLVQFVGSLVFVFWADKCLASGQKSLRGQGLAGARRSILKFGACFDFGC